MRPGENFYRYGTFIGVCITAALQCGILVGLYMADQERATLIARIEALERAR